LDFDEQLALAVAAGANGKVTGEASLKIALASGLRPVGGVENKGDLFNEISMDRGALPYASASS
jgi:hypothetical protein